VLQCVAVCCSVLHCVALCCSVLQCVAVCCSVLQCIAQGAHRRRRELNRSFASLFHIYRSLLARLLVCWISSSSSSTLLCMTFLEVAGLISYILIFSHVF